MHPAPYRHAYTAVMAAVAVLLFVSSALADVTAVPPTVAIARGQAASRSISYVFLDVTPGTYVSDGGQFLAGLTPIGDNNLVVSARVTGRTVAVEGLSVPAAVIERALARRTNMITYQRVFSNGVDNYGVEVQILITSEAGSDFELRRMELYFANRRGEVTVHRNDKGLKAYVDLRYSGSGVLQAFWEVDGRVLSTVNQHLVSAGQITLASPEIPALPTFDPGSHVVRFVVTSPSPEMTVPSIVYFVLPEEAGALGMDLLSPPEGAELPGLPQTFRWKGTGLAAMYIVRYYTNPESDPVFSAYTRETFYKLPQGLPNGGMSPGGTYYWSVTGFAQDGSVVGGSPARSFTIK